MPTDPPYRLLYNQDCTNLFGITKEPLTPAHVDHMVDEVADSGVEVMLINPNGQRACYPSRARQTMWDGYTPGDRTFFGPVPDADVPAREHFVSQMKRLADGGCDYLARALARCRTRGIVPGISVRMNDMHDVPWPGAHLFSRFYMEHPELRLSNPATCSWAATGLNYEHAAVREHYLELLRELVNDYDCEVLELDFLRFHSYFPRRDFARHRAIMTDFVRTVRDLTRAAGRRIWLTARLPATPAAASELGFDVAAWAREGLVDSIGIGAFFTTQWSLAVADYRAVVGPGVAIYACTEFNADRRGHGLPERDMPTSPELLRGYAAGHLAAGANGIELFNFFCAREGKTPREPTFATLSELKSLATLRGRPKTVTVSAGGQVSEVDGPTQMPLTIHGGQVRRLDLTLAAEPASARVVVDVRYTGGGAALREVANASLWLQVNHQSAGPAVAYSATGDGEARVVVATFDVRAEALRDGGNILLLRNEGDALSVISVDLHVHAP